MSKNEFTTLMAMPLDQLINQPLEKIKELNIDLAAFVRLKAELISYQK